jgi:hypothetical protein
LRNHIGIEERRLQEKEAERVREVFFTAAHSARRVLSDPRAEDLWDSGSVLEEFSVRGLAGHLVRAATSVRSYLEAPAPPSQEPISAAEYYARAVPNSDISSPLHVGIRQRGEEQASSGHAALIEHFDSTISDLATALKDEPPDRRIVVFDDLIIGLSDYLRTRIVELVVHTDDLACSIGDEDPRLPAKALDLAIETLVALGRYRHGDLAVLRALCRRERDSAHALRVL